jgi:uncharacterized protein (TIGR00251 family)
VSGTGGLPVVVRDGALQFAVKVVPGAAQDRVVGRYGDALKVQVAAPPEQGRANRRLVEVLAAWLGVPPRAVAVVAGHASPRKVVAVHGLDAATLQQRIAT